MERPDLESKTPTLAVAQSECRWAISSTSVIVLLNKREWGEEGERNGGKDGWRGGGKKGGGGREKGRKEKREGDRYFEVLRV